MFCKIDEALLAAIVAVGALTLKTLNSFVLPCTQRNATQLDSVRRQTAYADAWPMSIALTEIDVIHAQLALED